ncbi:1,2-phenylacetyl-CoA epoxidase subunit PaaD [Anaerobacillus sp. MEB173]|uniref:1,2-phenylacetyl-CoA epoxidase subunit PaaD n=1 Tax=Anaerobacillus sp. MEB173 TaxID=3383345 RepID=UPI003F8E06BB
MVEDKKQLQDRIMEMLEEVKDPEIPSVSISDLGMIAEIVTDGKHVLVKAKPTFVGCPALDIISRDIKNAIYKIEEIEEVEVTYIYDPAWTTDCITEKGREQLKEYGIAPPPANHKEGDPWHVDCPYCGSTYTTMENIFGPAACRSILYCKSCKNPFEAMKPVAN